MTNEELRTNIATKLIECGVKIIAIPGGCVQLLGQYGSILLSHDLSTVSPKHLERLCGERV
jgi:hypothetical protein